jgi:hypothetical protein
MMSAGDAGKVCQVLRILTPGTAGRTCSKRAVGMVKPIHFIAQLDDQIEKQDAVIVFDAFGVGTHVT